MGRFVNRDPLGEQGGHNLYAYVRNNAINRWDYLGMVDGVEVVAEDGGRLSVTSRLEAALARAIAERSSVARMSRSPADDYLDKISGQIDESPIERMAADAKAAFIAEHQAMGEAIRAAHRVLAKVEAANLARKANVYSKPAQVVATAFPAPNSTAPGSNSIGAFTATQMRPGDLIVYIDNNIVQSGVGAVTSGTAGHVAVALNGGTVLTARPGDGVTIDRTPYGGGSGANLVVLRPTSPVNTTALIQFAVQAVGNNPGYSYVAGALNALTGVVQSTQPVCSTVVLQAYLAAGVQVPTNATTPGALQQAPGFQQVWPAPPPPPPPPPPSGPKGPG